MPSKFIKNSKRVLSTLLFTCVLGNSGLSMAMDTPDERPATAAAATPQVLKHPGVLTFQQRLETTPGRANGKQGDRNYIAHFSSALKIPDELASAQTFAHAAASASTIVRAQVARLQTLLGQLETYKEVSNARTSDALQSTFDQLIETQKEGAGSLQTLNEQLIQYVIDTEEYEAAQAESSAQVIREREEALVADKAKREAALAEKAERDAALLAAKAEKEKQDLAAKAERERKELAEKAEKEATDLALKADIAAKALASEKERKAQLVAAEIAQQENALLAAKQKAEAEKASKAAKIEALKAKMRK
ncbi:MAG: hypothetical protein B7Y25_05830 [Alphaproteobacteria bacterium 16-39-46]|nr:MAG: hypothetical protein B7Y25_05830 [Alphaproteobacteria bacterium 16-39-46]OZA42519.1 MAG: hypothetical protein B7X84_05745 [Alphaproteobacteria bacterium 17-39-52]HQS84410.1 hypothetical protein [Alphaproteobacteria bacterium]HQS94219.1 hypothetical protein [Alphaproteobacteria bacterium]